MPKPVPVSIVRGGSHIEVQARLKGLARYRIYLGIFGGSKVGRQRAIREKIKGIPITKKGKLKKKRYQNIAKNVTMNNAQLLMMLENGSPLQNQPPRPLLAPSIKDAKNKEEISKIFYSAAQDALAGNRYRAQQKLSTAAKIAKKNAKGWFDNTNNAWAPNAASTIRKKGFDRPGIETTVMRESIDAKVIVLDQGTVQE